MLADVVGPGHVLVARAALAAYGHDEALRMTPGEPAFVIRPGSTAEVAEVLRIAGEHGLAVTARGSGTGLSGGAIPRPGGLVISFERMNQILEIDTANHVAVVQPGVTLAELDGASADHGLFYPVFPGEMSASLGGTIATNAGGMRAVKYGVTRRHVLGLEAVLASGEVIRTGGKHVKVSSGYDLTQLIIGSEGTLALVTEATLRLYPCLPGQATLLAPFGSLAEVIAAVPEIVASGVGPLVLEYIDMRAMALITQGEGVDLGIPGSVRESAQAYLIVAQEERNPDRLDAAVTDLVELLVGAGADDVYVPPAAAARRLIEARGKAFEPDDAARGQIMREIFAAARASGGAVSGEHGIGTAKVSYFLELADPVVVSLMRRVKDAFDPQGILNPGVLFGGSGANSVIRLREVMNEAQKTEAGATVHLPFEHLVSYLDSGGLADGVASLMPRAREDLAELVSFRSVADPRQFPARECEQAARWITRALLAEGFVDVAAVDTPDGTQSVYGLLPGPAGAPTVLLYAHYDVQPPLDESAWVSPPFQLTERDGRWYGRGAADCKGGLVMHLTALRALRGLRARPDHEDVPVTVKLIAEGSEEQGTGGLDRYAEAHPEMLAADAIVIGDAGNFRCGIPTVTATLRGQVLAEVTVETLEGNLHSGLFGGAAPDALAALVRMLASLHDDSGAVRVPGLDRDGEWSGLQYPEPDFRRDAKILEGVGLVGTGTVADRLWARPAVAVLGIDCPPVVGATPSLQARARALVSLRVPPGTATQDAAAALIGHLQSAAPWGARVTVTQRGSGQPFQADTSSPAYTAMRQAAREAYGQELEVAGMGASIPLCSTLATLYPEAEMLLIGLSEPEAQVHAVNESVSPAELEKLALTEALFLSRYAATHEPVF